MAEPVSPTPGAPAAPSARAEGAPRLPWGTWLAMWRRTFVVQGAWSYDVMIGPGLAYAIEPALRLLPGGPGGEAYRAALARQSQFFNCHPYFSAMAVGALARLELDQAPSAMITRFRGALCGPLGSVGDRLVWAAWLPACALIGLLVWGLGAGAAGAVLVFMLSYNMGHVALRAWGLSEGWRRGQQVASALASPWLRDGPAVIGRVAAVLAGLALPLVTGRLLSGDWVLAGAVLVAAVPAGYVISRLGGRVPGWAAAAGVLSLLSLVALLA